MSDPTGILTKLQPSIESAISKFVLSAGAEKLQGADLTDKLYNAIMDHVPGPLQSLVPEQTLRSYLDNAQDEIMQRISDAQSK